MVIANRGSFVGCDPLQRAVRCWRQLLSFCSVPHAQPGPGSLPIPGEQLSVASPRDSWSFFSSCKMSSSSPGLTQLSFLCVDPGCAGVAVDLRQRGRDEDLASESFEELYFSSTGGSKGPPVERTWLGFSVWQTALELWCSCSGEFPNCARVWHRERSCNMMPLKLSAAGESKAYSSSWGH